MACTEGALLNKLKTLVYDIEGGCGCCPCPPPPQCVPIPPTTEPCATCCMVCPPPILAPTSPEPVKPLRLPCPTNEDQFQMTDEEAERSRYANFYNNYNIDYHAESSKCNDRPYPDPRKDRCNGVALDGKNACCEDYRKQRNTNCETSCPTGFKTCAMKMFPPPNCHPCGVWCAEIQPCPPKPKKKVSKYEPGPCRRPCCKHWKPKDGECKYDEPCKAHCFNHPPGMKPKVKSVDVKQ